MTVLNYKSIFFSSFLFLFVGSASAATSDSGLPTVTQTGSPNSLVSGPGVQVTAGSSDSNVSLKVSYQSSKIPDEAHHDGTTVANGAQFTTVSLNASAPLGNDQENQTLFSNNGLGKANSIGLSVFHFMTDFIGQTDQQKEDLYKLCDVMRQKAQQAAPGRPALKSDDAAKLECSKSSFTQYDPDDLNKANQLRGGPAPGGWGIGVTGKIGQSDSTFYDPTSLGKNTVRNKPWSVGLAGSYVLPSNITMVTLQVDRKRTYTDQPISTMCPGNTSTTPVQCVTGSFGQPLGEYSSVVTLEGRTLLPRNLAVSFSIARDVNKNVTAVEVPLYLISNASDALTGGIKLDWGTDTKKLKLGVFVGVPFTVWQ